MNSTFHTSLLRPHIPNDDRRFPGRLPIQIPGFREKLEEWIVDRIVTHHRKGQGSKFLIQWKAGDRTWVTYREVTHLRALDRYCKLMGVKDAAGLSGNYVNADSENEDDEIVKVNSCMIRGGIKYVRDKLVLTNNPPHHPPLELSTHLPSTHPTMNQLNCNKLQECRGYKVAYRAYLRGGGPPVVPVPRRWQGYVKMSFLNVSTDPYPPPPMQQPVYQTMSENTVSMPSEALTTIIHVINHPSPAPGPHYLHSHMNPCRKLTRNHTLY